jgi:5-methylcytosine-specific restriction protein A
MPKRPARPCSARGCPNLVSGRGRFCAEHQSLEWSRQKQARTAPNDYGPEWNKIRNEFIRYYPHCARCGAKAEIVHHKVAREQGGDGWNNLMSLCRRCHSKIHADQGDLFG